MRVSFVVLALCVTVAPALAQEPVGCDKFKWLLDKERATLTGTDLPKLVSGGKAMWPLPFATMIALAPVADAKLPVTPERSPKSSNTFAGFIQVPAPAKAGTFAITLSSAGWIDVVQNGERIKSVAATGAAGCNGVRKSVKFQLAAAPFTVQLSGIEANSIAIAISRE
ncbi:MAG: hypothetical protein J2P55_12645 [Rhizobiales bacterium]|nr:hypothetical protein [Hyphomicrobiales bacterium]